MKHIIKLSLGLVVCAGIGLAFNCHPAAQDVPSAATAAVPVPVLIAPVQRATVPIVLTGLGTIRALNTAVIRSQVAGTLQSVNFIEGQQVKRGELLAQIDPRPEQATLDQARAQLERDEAHLANAQVNLARFQPLLSQGFATDQQVTDQKSQVAQLESDGKADQAAIESAQTQLSYTALTAPFDGVTGIRAVDVGNVIHPTDAAGLVTITQVQPIAVVFTLPARDIPDVQHALAAGTVQAVAYDQSGTLELDSGTLLLVNNEADPGTGTVQLKALFPNAGRTLWPGTFVNVQLTVRTVKDGLTIPSDALQQGENGPFVFVVGPGHKVTVHWVQVEQRGHGVALISQGLQDGQSVVAQGQYGLVDGTLVASAKPDQVADSSAATAGLLP